MTHQSFGLGVIATEEGSDVVVCQDERVRPLASLLGDAEAPSSVRGMLPLWDEWVARIETALATGDDGGWSAVEEVQFLPPVPDPSAVYCAGANYYDHVVEMNVPPPDKAMETIYHFLLPPASLTGYGQPVNRPDGVTKLDWEVELVAVIGRPAWRVPAEQALDYVAGYTVANDISVRQFDRIIHEIFGVRWILSKGQATMNPIGPAVVPSKFIEDPMNLDLSLHVNGAVRQQSNTNQMIWSLQEQIEALSHKVRLEPGDLILTGTPAGTAAAHGTYLADGDEMTAAVDGVGTLVNRVAPTSIEDTGLRVGDRVPQWN